MKQNPATAVDSTQNTVLTSTHTNHSTTTAATVVLTTVLPWLLLFIVYSILVHLYYSLLTIFHIMLMFLMCANWKKIMFKYTFVSSFPKSSLLRNEVKAHPLLRSPRSLGIFRHQIQQDPHPYKDWRSAYFVMYIFCELWYC